MGGGPSAAQGLPASPTRISTAEDIARSGATGVAEGIIGIQGSFGDADQYMRRGALWALEQLGLPTDHIELAKMPSVLPTSEQITGAVENVAGPLYQPQTVPGEYARTAGQFAPALATGSGGVVRRGLQYAIPALASETGGQIGRQFGPAAEAAGRVGGAFLGPGAPKVTPALPSTDRMRAASQLNYMRAEQSGLEATGSSFRNAVLGLAHKVGKEGIDPGLHPKSMAVMRRLHAVADDFAPKQPSPMSPLTGVTPKPPTGTVSIRELDTLRKVANDAVTSPEAADRRLARIIVGRMDEYLDTLAPGDVAAGNLKQATDALTQARKGWAQMRKAETVDEMLETAGLTAGQFSVNHSSNGF